MVTQTSTRRASPDVAYDADPRTGFPVYDSFNNGTAAPWSQFGGTSAGSPQWAALVAIADQGRVLAGKAALDGPSQLLPMLYGLAAQDFHDVTAGTSFGQPNFTAGPGYDLVTGRGTPVANLVVADLVGAAATTTTLSTSTATAVFGQPVTLTATVTSAAGVPTGTVTFREGTTVLGTAPVNAAGQATLAVSLGVGNHALTASFAGTGNFADSTSAVVAVTVNPRGDHGRPGLVGQPGRHGPGGDLHGHGGRRRPGGRHADRHGHVPGRQRDPGDRRGRRPAAGRRSRPASRPRAATPSPPSTTATPTSWAARSPSPSR